MFSHLRGQFAFALWDSRRRTLVLGRDRVGICPLHWARIGNWLLFGSEIKAILASQMVPIVADPRGLNHVFTFFAMPSRRTAFRGISAVAPGCYLKIQYDRRGAVADVREKQYWDFDFPDRGDEYRPATEKELMDRLDETLVRAIRIRMRADVPVAAYLGGGVDSAVLVAASRQNGCPPVTAFTAQIADPKLNETAAATSIAQHIGLTRQIVNCDADLLSQVYPQVVTAADCPVVDPNSGSLFALSRAVKHAGLKVVLTGEGADEALAGYVWFKIHKMFRLLDRQSWQPSVSLFRLVFRTLYPQAPSGEFDRVNDAVGGVQAQAMVYHLTSVVRWRLLSREMNLELADHRPHDDLGFNTETVRRWHPLNQSLYFGYKSQLAGLLLNHRGDRAAMANSVETRYPFLDEDFIQLCCQIHPRWKLRGLRRDKHALRRMATRYLPRRFALRPKAMFRAPFRDTFFPCSQPYVRQLLSPESLRLTPYFDADQVERYFKNFQSRRPFHLSHKLFDDMALTTILATQMWHHLYLSGDLCELPTWSPPAVQRKRGETRTPS
jgi:asparagine synthase (glutamine-hydrolysing)